jgi:hypothetical protein
MRSLEKETMTSATAAYADPDPMDTGSTFTVEELGAIFSDAAKFARMVMEGEIDSDTAANCVVERVREIHTNTFDKGKLDIGDCIVDYLYGGNSDLALSNTTTRPDSYTKVCEHTDLPVSRKTLNSWTRAAALRRLLKESGKHFPHLRVSHYIELATLKSSSQRQDLAKEANDNQYTVEKIRQRVREIEGRGSGKSSDVKTKVDKGLRQSLSLPTDDTVSQFVTDKAVIRKEYSDSKAYETLKQVKKFREEMEKRMELLDAFEGNLREIVEEDIGSPNN